MADEPVKEPVTPKLDLVAVRVDPESGYLYAPVAQMDVDPVEAVVAFLNSVDPDVLERAVLHEHAELPTAEGFVEALKGMARGGR
jgi:hypothetical protein